MFSSLRGKAKPFYSHQVWTGDGGKVPSTSSYAHQDVRSKSETSSYFSPKPATSNREHQPGVSRYLELTPPGLGYAKSQQLVLDHISDSTSIDTSSGSSVMDLMYKKAMEETQKCDALTLEVQELRKQLASVQSDKNFSEQVIQELTIELGLMGPRLGLIESQQILNRDVGSILASGGVPPLDITLNGWTYIRVGKPGDGWRGDFYNPIEPFPPGRPAYRGNDSPTLPPLPKRTSLGGNSSAGTTLPQRSFKHASVVDGRLSPPVLSAPERNTWAGNSRSSQGQSSSPKGLPPREGSVSFPLDRPTHRHNAASASPGISSVYFNWSPNKGKKK